MDTAAAFAFIRSQHPGAGVVRVEASSSTLTIAAAKPWILIGKAGASWDVLVAELARFGAGEVLVEQVAQPELEPQLIVDDILKRVAATADAAECDATVQRLASLRVEMALRAGAIAAHVVIDGPTISGGRGIEAGAAIAATGVVVAVGEGHDGQGAHVSCTARVQRP